MAYGWFGWRPYVSVAQRRRNAAREIARLRKKGRSIAPVVIEGRVIAKSFWGRAWCDNLEGYSDFANRLPRGRTYVRNGSVMDLQIGDGTVQALVSGSELYHVAVTIKPLPRPRWLAVIKECAGKIDSLVELLRGTFSRGVMEVLIRPQTGLFPAPRDIAFECSCPDWASMCKHVAATLYGVGARFDRHPELFFRLRRVDQTELLAEAGTGAAIAAATNGKRKRIAESALADVFGIEIDGAPAAAVPESGAAATRPSRRGATRSAGPPVAIPKSGRKSKALNSNGAHGEHRVPVGSLTTRRSTAEKLRSRRPRR